MNYTDSDHYMCYSFKTQSKLNYSDKSRDSYGCFYLEYHFIENYVVLRFFRFLSNLSDSCWERWTFSLQKTEKEKLKNLDGFCKEIDVPTARSNEPNSTKSNSPDPDLSSLAKHLLKS